MTLEELTKNADDVRDEIEGYRRRLLDMGPQEAASVRSMITDLDSRIHDVETRCARLMAERMIISGPV